MRYKVNIIFLHTKFFFVFFQKNLLDYHKSAISLPISNRNGPDNHCAATGFLPA